jgi:antirestriction protein
MSEEIQIYVADLAAYNSGILHGVFIDPTDDLDRIWEQIKEMLRISPVEDAEEYAIHDYEGFGGYKVSEYEGIEQVHEIACFIQEYPDFGAELLSYYSDLESARKVAEETYYGCFESISDYAQELTESCQDIPENLIFYIDYERMGRDMELSGDIFTIETKHDEVHIFGNY